MTRRLFMILLWCQTTAVLAFGGTTMIRTTSIRPAANQRSLLATDATFGATTTRSLVVHYLGKSKSTTSSSSLHLFHRSAQGNRQKRMIPTWLHKCVCWIRNSLLVWSFVLMCTAGSGYTTTTSTPLPLHLRGANRPLAAIMGRRSTVRNPNKAQLRFWSKSSNKIRRSTSTTTTNMNEGDLLTRKQSVFLVVAIATTGYLSAYYGRESNRSEENKDDDYYDFRKYHNKNRLWKEFSQERALNQTIPSMYHLFRSPSSTDKENKNKPVDFDPLAVMWKKRNPQDRSVVRANKISQPEIILSQESQDFVQQLERQVADDAAAEATSWELQEFDPKLSIVVQSTTSSSSPTTTTTHSNSSLVLSWTSTSFDHLSSSVSAFYEDPIEVVIEQKEQQDLAAKNATSLKMDQAEVAVEENPADLQARYAAIESLEDRAFQILHDLGMIDEHVQQPAPDAEDEPNDDDPAPQNDHPDADLR